MRRHSYSGLPAAPGRGTAPVTSGRAWGRRYFAVQGVAGAAWWVSVALLPGVRSATLGTLNPVLVGAVDIPFFVLASLLVGAGVRWALWVVVPWTVGVAAAMVAYASLTQAAGWGAVAMLAAAAGTLWAGCLVRWGRVPTERLLVGPLRFRLAAPASVPRYLARTFTQILVFWGFFLGVLPLVIAWCEARWLLRVPLPPAASNIVSSASVALLIGASFLGIWSAITMARVGRGTPLPSAMAQRLVIAGPYRFVRNPMALSAITQGVAVGGIWGSWLVVLYALSGALVWEILVRPAEEADLTSRFGTEFVAYQRAVWRWLPRCPGRRRSATLAACAS